MMKAFIFDMDGVIIDSEPIHFDVDIKTMNYFGANINKQDLEKYVGMTNPEMWKLIKVEYNLNNSITEIIDYQLRIKINVLDQLEIVPIEGIKELIIKLNKNKIPIAIASSSPRIFIERVLLKFGLSSFFECIVSAEEVNRGKPEPDVYLEAARLLGVDPISCVALEDSMNGIFSAKAAGMKCIGYINLNSGNQNLSEADFIVNFIKEIKIEELMGGKS